MSAERKSGCVVGAQKQNRTTSFLTTLRATWSHVSSSETCQQAALGNEMSYLPALAAEFQSFSRDLPASLSPDLRGPAAEVRVLFIHRGTATRLCARAVSDKPAPLALGELGRQSLPAGSRAGTSTSFHRGHPGADGC